MPKFSAISLERLKTCHPLLQGLMHDVILSRDCIILDGHRDAARQNRLYDMGKSRVRWPHGRHNQYPSMAVDAAPYFKDAPHVRWPDPKSPHYAVELGRWYMFVGYVQRAAEELGIALRCGADWDGDHETTDQGFHDLAHFELLHSQKV